MRRFVIASVFLTINGRSEAPQRARKRPMINILCVSPAPGPVADRRAFDRKFSIALADTELSRIVRRTGLRTTGQSH
jgi:hypothetical protein